MTENKTSAAKSFDFGSALKTAKFTDELTSQTTAGRVRTPSAFDKPLTEAKNAGKVLAFDLPADAVADALKEARSAARYLGFRLDVGQTDAGKGMVTLELKPQPKRERKAKPATDASNA